MDFKAHFLIAFFSSAILFGILNTYLIHADMLVYIFAVGMATVFGVVSDVDLTGTTPRGLLNIGVALFGILVGIYQNPFQLTFEWLKSVIIIALAVFGIYFVIMEFVIKKHRGITHTLIFGILAALLFYFVVGLNMWVSVAPIWGILVHILLDREKVKVA